MARIKVRENPEFSRVYPKAHNMTVEIVTRSGQRFKAAETFPKGYRQNPLSDAELEAKFTSMADEVLGPAGSRRALDLLWHLDELKRVADLFDAFLIQPSRLAA